MLPPIIDTHCHLTNERFASDRDAVIAAAWDTGVRRCITIGTGIADGRAARDLARRFPDRISCTVGLDPFSGHEAGDSFPDHLRQLDELLTEGGFCALGEIGLEYFHTLDAHAVQAERLEQQLELAVRHRLPVVIHVRDAHPDMIACLRRHPRNRGVIHSFSGGPDEARAYLDLGYHLGFNGMVTFKANEALRRAAAMVPNDRLLVETDSPYLAPVPMRGRRCDPAHVLHTLELVAQVRGQRIEDLAQWTTRTATLLFALPAPA
ncbi:MAG: TatD family hydrolase [Planctomycetes bacterium]|nr:TatD family hydrolase [Planctomycetota bacterium]